MYLELYAQLQSTESGNQLFLFSVSLFYVVALTHKVKVITIVNNEYLDLEVDGCVLSEVMSHH